MLKVRSLNLKGKIFKVVIDSADETDKRISVTPYVVEGLKMVEVVPTRYVMLDKPYSEAPEEADKVIEPYLRDAVYEINEYCLRLKGD